MEEVRGYKFNFMGAKQLPQIELKYLMYKTVEILTTWGEKIPCKIVNYNCKL